MPVDIKIGLPVLATSFINGISTSSNEAILYAGALRPSNSSTAVSSKGDEKQVIPISFANKKSSLCQSYGV